jgi:hypothetical protein
LLAPLVADHQAHHGRSGDADAVGELLRDQAQAVGPAAHAFLCSRGDQAIACSLAFSITGQLAMRAFGLRHAERTAAREYFELGYYLPIETAYQIGATSVHLGIGTLSAKIRCGARVTPLWGLATSNGALDTDAATLREHNTRQWRQILDQVGPYRDALDGDPGAVSAQ